jgi:peptidase E
VIYVGGGNAANMLAIWRVHGVDKALKKAWERGVVLAGWSAGAICWFDGGLTDSFGPDLAPLRDGLRFLEGSFCPHYDSESLRRPRYEETVGSGALPDGYAADDGVGLLFSGRDFAEAVASLPGQHAYRVERRRNNSVEETQIRARLLR